MLNIFVQFLFYEKREFRLRLFSVLSGFCLFCFVCLKINSSNFLFCSFPVCDAVSPLCQALAVGQRTT